MKENKSILPKRDSKNLKYNTLSRSRQRKLTLQLSNIVLGYTWAERTRGQNLMPGSCLKNLDACNQFSLQETKGLPELKMEVPHRSAVRGLC